MNLTHNRHEPVTRLNCNEDSGRPSSMERFFSTGPAPEYLRKTPRPLYTPSERARRDASPWTLVQGLLAPAQFIVFAASLYLVIDYLRTGDGLVAAQISIVVKTLFLYAIMVTGAIWEKQVFGRYLFAHSFFWEDVFSMLVIALHTAYLYALATDALSAQNLMYLALAAYATYVINAGQFLIKLRAARLESSTPGLAEATR